MDQEELAENEEGKTETEADHPAKGFDIASDLGNFLLEFGLDPGDFLFEFRLSLDQVRFGGKVGGGDMAPSPGQSLRLLGRESREGREGRMMESGGQNVLHSMQTVFAGMGRPIPPVGGKQE